MEVMKVRMVSRFCYLTYIRYITCVTYITARVRALSHHLIPPCSLRSIQLRICGVE
jgi:hypothetical protein